jgi:predicted ferric reductase
VRYKLFHRTGWWFLLGLCAVPVILWAATPSFLERFSTPITTIQSIGQIAALIGFTMFAFNLLLATRIKWFEDLFGGLNKVFIAHHIIGGLALIALLVHPLMMALRYVPISVHEAAMLLVPQTGNLPVAYGIVALSGLIFLLILTFFTKLPYRVWLLTHKFIGVFFFLAILHVMLTPNDLTTNIPLLFWMLGLCGLGLGAYIYRTLLPGIFVRRYDYVVSSAKTVGPGVVQVDLRPVRWAMNFRAGQFLFVSFHHPGISPEFHPFTISAAPGIGDLTITVKSLGSYTGHLIQALPTLTGATAKVEGAYGRFSYGNFGNPRQIWVAGGIGITPFLSMARALGPDVTQVDLYYSVKNETELVGIQELQAVQARGQNQIFRLFPFIADKQGFLTASYLDKTSGGLQGKDILLCGPPPMMKALKQQLGELGVPKRRVHSEEFSLQ